MRYKIKILLSVSGWADFATQALPRIPHKTRKIDDEIIVINVSGIRYMCWKSTLEVSEDELNFSCAVEKVRK